MDAGAIRPDLARKLRPPGAGPAACKICGGEARPTGIVDFNRSCEDARGLRLPRTGVPVQYRQCGTCGLVFTDTFDDWTQTDFEAHVYNDSYIQVDPDYVAKRPEGMAATVTATFAADRAALDVLDYGGGTGRFAEVLREAGYRCETYDPFTPRFAARPDRRFNLITCFETLEHMPDPVGGAEDIASLLTDDGAAVIGTVTQPADFASFGLGWWYVGPRNGHVTLYSRQALARLWGRFGFALASFNDSTHIAFRQAATPPWIARLLGPA
ncbi:MAG: class I SAM-dependent methyltransferase [Phenylobacterium sp.]|uniref:class I SAM-dependent methyltransferase n=1 Tax=Phenylobacterium sp. TaxID=1871053 RepID=UPI001A4B7A7A|nr:class I SAM-dependent methyltransferase [Phenylobacterium sp.]MBL8553813.1 class I SAM-dependent methyltransferase [Phenylobacterium sp.]